MASLFEVRFSQNVASKYMQNVFHYHVPGEGGTAAELATKWKTDVLPKINSWQSNSLTNHSLKVLSVFDLADFAEETLSGAGGAASGEYLPLHDCVNFTMKVNTRAVRAGKKRFSGLTEGDTSQGWVTNAVVITALTTLRTQLGTNLVGASAVQYQPVVVKRVMEVDPDTGKETYRMPETVGEYVFGNIQTVLLNLKITTQNSRK